MGVAIALGIACLVVNGLNGIEFASYFTRLFDFVANTFVMVDPFYGFVVGWQNYSANAISLWSSITTRGIAVVIEWLLSLPGAILGSVVTIPGVTII